MDRRSKITSLKSWSVILLTFYTSVIMTARPDGIDNVYNPYEAYTSTQTYRDVTTYLNGNKEICHLMDAYANGELKRFILWLEENPEFEDQFKELEELGRTLIYVTSYDEDTTFVNDYVRNHPDCWFDYRQALLELKNNGHYYHLPKLPSSKAPYRAMNFHSLICPPNTALRGRTTNGILCSRYNIKLEPKIPTILKDTKDVTFCELSSKNDQALVCAIKSNNETAHLCMDLYAVTEHPARLICTSMSEGCGSKDTTCGILLPNIGGETTPGPVHICCSNKTETSSPVESIHDTDGKIIHITQIRQLLNDLKVCSPPRGGALNHRT